jgi:hypothetical protein
MMQDRERRRVSLSTISGKRRVKSLPARLKSLTCAPFLRDAKAVVLDLVQPLAALGQFCGFDRKARRDEPGR